MEAITASRLNYSVCRACLSQRLEKFLSLGESLHQQLTIADILMMCVPQLRVELGADELPQQICADCLHKLKITYQFQQLCIASDVRLRTELSSVEPAICTTTIQRQPSTDDPLMDDGMQLTEGVDNAVPMDDKECLLTPLQDSEENKLRCGTEEVDTLVMDIKIEEDEVGNLKEIEFAAEPPTLPETHLLESKTNVENAAESKRPPDCETTDEDDNVDMVEKPKGAARLKHKCAECGKQFKRSACLQQHLSVHSPSQPFECEHCKYRFSTVHQLRAHKLSHSKQLRQTPADGYGCPYCPRRFAVRQSCVAHQGSHLNASAKTAYKCDYCAKRYESLAHLNAHFRKCPKHRTHKCPQCPKSFGTAALLKGHLALHKRVEQCAKAPLCAFLCPHCGKSFSSRGNLRQHMLRHTSERQYQCHECPSKFSTQSDLTKHKSVHSNTKPFVCDECGASFTRSSTLKKHKHIHTGQRPFKCGECNMTFVFRNILERHMRTHTGERPYRCKYCERAYAESGDLTKHLRTHLGKNTYLCGECPAAFKYHAQLRAHSAQHYKEQTNAAAAKDAEETLAAANESTAALKTESIKQLQEKACDADCSY